MCTRKDKSICSVNGITNVTAYVCLSRKEKVPVYFEKHGLCKILFVLILGFFENKEGLHCHEPVYKWQLIFLKTKMDSLPVSH